MQITLDTVFPAICEFEQSKLVKNRLNEVELDWIGQN